MLKKKLLKKVVVIGMMATMITGCSQEVQTTHVDSLNSYKMRHRGGNAACCKGNTQMY